MELSMVQAVGCTRYSPSARFRGPSASVFFPEKFGTSILSEKYCYGRAEPPRNLRKWDRYLQRNITGPGASFVAFCEQLLQCSSSFVVRPGSVAIKRNPVNYERCRPKHEKPFICFAAEGSSRNQAGTVTQKTVWPCLLPRPLIYSSSLSDVDSVQLSELWATTLDVKRDPQKILKAMRHSFAFIVVLAEVEEASPSGVDRRLKTVGVGRAISDGTFIASICDVAVDPEYQRRGIGRRIVKKLVENMKKTGGPSGYAVFPPPIARRFFWMIGFRSDKKYKMMAYRGKEDVQLLENSEEEINQSEERELVVTEAE
ncbi:hypothetical protein R1sor_006281 [Riccia sorocarpa]|uniref:N-acetyltransferase domain-containing protein n=1 Tax=Riccia sorocarpa TaxID=122646 RepID=A0ABD3HRB0_9MARC